MQEYKYKNATVRIHGTYDREKLEEATKIFMKKVNKRKKEEKWTRS